MEYAYPNVLVSTQWINDHLDDPKIRIVEVDYIPTTSYILVHIPGAVLFDWKQDIIDSRKRDVISKDDLEESLQRIGINNDTTIIVYGDFKNWFATFAFWIFKYYGVKDVIGTQDKILVDVRTNDEYNGKTLAPTEYSTEYGQMGGHIPGAVNVPWNKMVNENGTLKSAEELKKLYESLNVTPDKEVITYCGIGERAAYTWFVLKYLLGYPNVKSYDGSWLEWGNTMGNPIEK